MLTQLHVRHFAIVKDLSIELKAGMTAITGETGAGKSIALDALGLCLGARAEASMVRNGADKAEISAVFDIHSNAPAQAWLAEHELNIDEDCILRRTLTVEGRSKGYINGAPVPMAMLKTLGRMLVNIHGQHEHQLLSNSDHQLQLLDQFGDHTALVTQVRQAWQQWQSLRKEQRQLQEEADQLQARRQLISYQVNELQTFALQPDEFTQIESDHQRLANASTLRDEAAFSLNSLYDGEHNNAFSLVQAVLERLAAQQHLDSQLTPIVDLLGEAGVQIEEAVRELRHYHDDIDIDSEQLQVVEDRMTAAMQLAKKHQVAPEQLPALQAELEEELAQISACHERADNLQDELNAVEQAYHKQAEKLSQSRKKAAAQLNKRITASMRELNMQAGVFEAALHSDTSFASAVGSDQLQFRVTTNPGQPMQPLNKIASGGELSRISLAIQVATADQASTPTLMFDEVDVGVSGPTAATVGKLLRHLGASSQVICVTHLPQVAAKAHQQMCVQKSHSKNSTETTMILVQGDDRVVELARLLGGDAISDKAMANAQDLLAS